jgi:hypothetical protein
MPPKAIYLVNPASDFPTYFGAEAHARKKGKATTLMADLAVPTLAAMVPDDFQVSLCDENVSPVDYETPAEFVGITGKVTQYGRMVAIAKEFRRRGKVLLIGGPHASLSPSALRPYCDILVRGEAEELAEELFADLREGCWRDEYVGGKPELALSPLPRWDLYPNRRAMMATLQTSRGCPFQCDFCDVIQYLGRKQRHKAPAQVLRELDEVYRHRYRQVFLADDNFTIYRSRTKELLAALRDWSLRQNGGKVQFTTQASIDAAKDEELLRMCAEAGLTQVFVGIETPNADALRESKKYQNLGVDLIDLVQRFLRNGIWVIAGMVVGFDSDGPDIFQRQLEFALSTPIPIFTLGALVAPAATPLHARMAQEGRLVEEGSEVAAMPWSTNIIPRRMSRDELLGGIRWLARRLYDPLAFQERVLRFIDCFGPRRDPRRNEAPIRVDNLSILKSLAQLGSAEEKLVSRICSRLVEKPEASEAVAQMLSRYLQIRYMYQEARIWSPLTPSLAPSVAPEPGPLLPSVESPAES